MMNNAPYYKKRPPGSLHALSRVLGITEEELQAVAIRTGELYYVAKRISKPDGSTRTVYGVREPLKTIQRRVLRGVLVNAHYPSYLKGGIRDPDRIRGYRRNAACHDSSAIVFSEDIENFFPSITENSVRLVFQHTLCFPQAVSRILARLCTLDGTLPQGASPSTYLANLVLARYEPDVFDDLESRGLAYTRYVDDINVSSPTPLCAGEKYEVVSKMRALIERAGYRPKRSKHRIATQRDRMSIHNLSVNGEVSLDRKKRKRIRAAVRQLEVRVHDADPGSDFKKALARASGRAAEVRAFHPVEGSRLMDRIRAVRKEGVARRIC